MSDIGQTKIELPWDAPGWEARVLRWVRARVRGTPYETVSRVESVRRWTLSSVLRIPTGGGDLYFKAVPPMFASEARITAALSRIFPDNVPMPIAIDARRNWMLLPDLGRENLQEGVPVEEWCRVMKLLAGMQVECVGRMEALLRAGCGDRRLETMPGELNALCEDELLLSLLGGEDREGLREAAPRLKDLCFRLAEYRVPETLTHGDFHGGNITRSVGRHVVFDWTDAAIAHPFLDLAIVLNWHAPPVPEGASRWRAPTDHERVRAAYLEEWTAWEPMDRLYEAMRIAFPLASLYQVLSLRRMIRALGEGGMGDLRNGPTLWVGRLLRALGNG